MKVSFVAGFGPIIREADAAHAFWRDGLGIAFFPRFFVEGELASGKLVQLLPEFPGPELAINAVYETRRHLLPKVAAFLGFLKGNFGPEAKA